MFKNLFLTLSFFAFFANSSFSQQPYLMREMDSLVTLIKQDPDDITKVDHLSWLARDFSFLYLPDSVRHYIDISLELNNKLLKKEGLAKNEKVKLLDAKAYSYSVLGMCYTDQGNYGEALKNHFIALKIFDSIASRSGVSSCYTNIGLIYYYQTNYTSALKYHFDALKLDTEAGDKDGIGIVNNNIAICYVDMGRYDEALKHHLVSLKIKEEQKDKFGIATTYNNISAIYITKGDILTSLDYSAKALRIFEDIGERDGIALSCYNIGSGLLKQKKLQEAEKYFLRSRDLSLETGYKENLKEVYEALSEMYEANGNDKLALKNHKLHIQCRDSLESELSHEKSIQSRMTYEFDKKEAIAQAEHKKEIENNQTLANEKHRKQNLVIFFVIGALLLVILFSGFIFRSLHVTRKQKNIIEQQKHFVEESQKEIIDSITYAKRLQQAILPSDEEIKKHLADSFVLYKPKDIVAGDFYWLHVSPSDETRQEDEIIYIAAADSTGHGVPGAMVSVVCSNALNRAVTEFKLVDPGKILDKTRELVLETFAKSEDDIKDGMDISLLAINRTSKQITWSGANNPLWYISSIVEAGQSKVVLNEIRPDKQPIGKVENQQPFTTHVLELKSGDIFYLITDGFADQFGGEKGKKYKHKQLKSNLIDNCNFPMAQQKETLIKAFNIWKGGLEQVDDVTIIGVKV